MQFRFALLDERSHGLPQVVETNTPQLEDLTGECSLYYEYMSRIYLADSNPIEPAALDTLHPDIKMEVSWRSR